MQSRPLTVYPRPEGIAQLALLLSGLPSTQL